MRQPKKLPISRTDLQTWGRCFRSIEGAYAEGMVERNAPLQPDSLFALVPLVNDQHVRALWLAGGMDTKGPQSAWHRIGDFNSFKLSVRSARIRRSLFSSSRWLSSFGFWFEKRPEGGIDFMPANKTIAIDGLGFANTENIPDILLLIDQIRLGSWPFVRLSEALR